MHGKPSTVRILGGRLFEGLPDRLKVGRFHSLYARRDTLPAELAVTAESEDGVVMALEIAAYRSQPCSPRIDSVANQTQIHCHPLWSRRA